LFGRQTAPDSVSRIKTKGGQADILTPFCFDSGADEQDRTADLLITNQLLYRLSYIGIPSIRDHP
jgi:hypothetical protein